MPKQGYFYVRRSFEEVLELLLYHVLQVSSSGEVTTSLTGSAALRTSLTDSVVLGFTGSSSYISSS